MGSPPLSSEEIHELFSQSEINKIYKTKVYIFSSYFAIILSAGLYYLLSE